MSNSIWHKREETPKDFCDVVLADFRTGSCCVFFSPFHNVSFDYDKWCYLTDLIAQADKAERLQKAVTELYLEIDEFFANLKGGFYEPKNVDAQRKLGDLRIKLQRLKKSNN